jgi:hypothetical protein
MTMKAFLPSVFVLFACTGANAQPQKLNLDGMDLSGLGDLLGALGGAGAKIGGPGAAGQNEDGSCPTLCKETFPVPKRHIRTCCLVCCPERAFPIDSPFLFLALVRTTTGPYSNGCSVPESMRAGLGDYSHFEPCCDLHDACYFSCGVPKTFCETEFQKCMKGQCQMKRTNKEREDCDGMANLFVMGTSLFGCQGYTELQGEGCECVAVRETANELVRQYAHDFYSVYNQTHTLPDSFLAKFLNFPSHSSRAKQVGKHGELIFRLYRKYPRSIEVITRDGKSGRTHDTYFYPPAQITSDEF